MNKFVPKLPSVEKDYEKLVSKVGYVDSQQRVNAMLREGMQLRQFRLNLDNDGESRISAAVHEAIDSVADLASEAVQYSYDKVDAVGLMQAQMRDLDAKYKKAQSDASTASHKRLEAEKNALSEKIKGLQSQLDSIGAQKTDATGGVS